MKHLQASFKCRLCWRITLVVFALILAIESVILVPSAWSFLEREHQQLAQKAQILIEPALAEARVLEDDIEARLSGVAGLYGLHHVTVNDASGKRMATVGSPPPLQTEYDGDNTMAVPIFRDTDRNLMAVAWRSEHQPQPGIVAWMDTSAIADKLIAYLLRIAGLVAIIVLVVTAGTMLVLDLAILRPILALRESAMRAAGATDRASSWTLSTDRTDEIGDLITAHNTMLLEVTQSHRRDREMAREREQFLTRHDQATGLPNRASLEDFLDQQIAVGHRLVLLHIAIQQFHTLDITHGNGTSERIINQISSRLRRVAAPDDFIARIEMDRLAVARVCGATPMEAEEFAEEILCIAERPFHSKTGADITIGLKIGISVSREEAATGGEMMSHADMALIRTYEDTAYRYEFYSPDLAERARFRQNLLYDLSRAIDRGEMYVTLQPRMELRGQCSVTMTGTEVLLRWQHPQQGLVSPDVFIPMAESAGLMNAINDFVLRSACSLIARWLKYYGHSPRVAINISGQEFSQPDLVDKIRNALKNHNIPGTFLELEITETTTMADIGHTLEVLNNLKTLGVSVSIDDFGTGYSSLSYLKQFSVDAIKIDKSFVDDIGHADDAEAICGAILRLGQTLGMRVVAEGVETADQLAFLCDRKCDEAQGYYFSRPVSIDEFENKWLLQEARA